MNKKRTMSLGPVAVRDQYRKEDEEDEQEAYDESGTIGVALHWPPTPFLINRLLFVHHCHQHSWYNHHHYHHQWHSHRLSIFKMLKHHICLK